MSKISYMSKEGYNRLMEELDELKSTGRLEAAKAIAEARDKGDLSENAEYDAAKDAQGMLELKINQLENVLAHAKIINKTEIDTSQVSVLTNVKIRNVKTGKELTYKLVSESEANLKERKISIRSPLGSGLLGKKVKEVAQVTTPAGMQEFEIVDISLD